MSSFRAAARGLIRRVAAEATMPVIKHYAQATAMSMSISSADLDLAEQLVVNSKCQRLGVCNAAESLVVHADVAAEFLPRAGELLAYRTGHRDSRRRKVPAVHTGARRQRPKMPTLAKSTSVQSSP